MSLAKTGANITATELSRDPIEKNSKKILQQLK